MKVLKKKLILILFPMLLISCGYAPLYKNLQNLDFTISIKNTSGDRKVNNLVKSKLNSYTKNETKKIYNINYISDYRKVITAKDTTGAATEYKLILKINFIIKSSEINKNFKFSESFNMQSIRDRLEEIEYEENIQKSLVNIITRKLILQLSQIQ